MTATIIPWPVDRRFWQPYRRPTVPVVLRPDDQIPRGCCYLEHNADASAVLKYVNPLDMLEDELSSKK